MKNPGINFEKSLIKHFFGKTWKFFLQFCGIFFLENIGKTGKPWDNLDKILLLHVENSLLTYRKPWENCEKTLSNFSKNLRKF
jgi:hypothetical protein